MATWDNNDQAQLPTGYQAPGRAPPERITAGAGIPLELYRQVMVEHAQCVRSPTLTVGAARGNCSLFTREALDDADGIDADPTHF